MAIMRTLSANSFSYCDNCEHQNGARSGTHPHCHRGGLSIVPVWVMQDKGLLTRRGVTAEIVQNPSSPVAIQAMLSGEVEAIVTSAATLGLRAWPEPRLLRSCQRRRPSRRFDGGQKHHRRQSAQG